jgi:DNA-binding Lrp family transcriptional regulator
LLIEIPTVRNARSHVDPRQRTPRHFRLKSVSYASGRPHARRPGAELDEFHRFLTQVLPRIGGVANTRTIIPVKRIKETTAVKIA